MNTRRLYLTSRDSNPRVIFNDKVQIDLSKANLNVESNQKMGLSIVRATLPTTLEAVPRTTTVSNVGNNKDVSLLSFSISGTPHRLFFNDWSILNNPGADYHMTWTVQTTIDNIVEKINTLSGLNNLIKVGSLDLGNRLVYGTANTTPIIFSHTESSSNILRALGLNTESDTTLSPTITETPYNVNLAGLLPVVYVRTNIGVGGYMSMKGGMTMNILGSIPVEISNLNAGNNVESFTGTTQTVRYQPASSINYVNHANEGSHKIITNQHINSITLELLNSEGVIVGTGLNDYSITLEVKTYN